MKQMEKKENSRFHIFERYFFHRAHPKSTFTVEVFPGILATFGEPKSKLKSQRYHLARLQVSRDSYSEDIAIAFWKRFHVRYIGHKQKNRNLPPIYRVVGSPNRLIHGGYIALCEHARNERDTFILQQSYGYWRDRVYSESRISKYVLAQQEALASLLNKIRAFPSILKDMPTTDWRVFEKIVAEIFDKFGYDVALTKKTRDGGKDIIALHKSGEKTERLLIECKHWKDKIDVKPVRELIGVAFAEEDLPTGIILATTSFFTPDAKRIMINPAFSIELERKDFNDVLNWIGEYSAIQFTPKGDKRLSFERAKN